jgi:hypothetical protein
MGGVGEIRRMGRNAMRQQQVVNKLNNKKIT